jgi:hypothetical protein
MRRPHCRGNGSTREEPAAAGGSRRTSLRLHTRDLPRTTLLQNSTRAPMPLRIGQWRPNRPRARTRCFHPSPPSIGLGARALRCPGAPAFRGTRGLALRPTPGPSSSGGDWQRECIRLVVRASSLYSIAYRDREEEALMKTQCSIVTLAVGVTLALASAAQADRWGQDGQGDRSLPSSKTFAVNHSTTKAQKAARLRAQHAAMADFWRLHGAGGVDPEGVYTPAVPPAATPGNPATTEIAGTVCALGDWCG